jgi:hypothetical protein
LSVGSMKLDVPPSPISSESPAGRGFCKIMSAKS